MKEAAEDSKKPPREVWNALVRKIFEVPTVHDPKCRKIKNNLFRSQEVGEVGIPHMKSQEAFTRVLQYRRAALLPPIPRTSVVHSHWSRTYITALSLVDLNSSFNQSKHSISTDHVQSECKVLKESDFRYC